MVISHAKASKTRLGALNAFLVIGRYPTIARYTNMDVRNF